MTTTQATLKTLVQCRSLWFWHLIGGTLCLVTLIRPLTSAAGRDGAVVAVLAVPLWNGVISTSLWKEFLSRPFSFSLPRHQLVWRRTLFSIGFVVAAVCTLVTLFVPANTPEVVATRAAQTFLLSMGMFMVGVFITTQTPNAGFLTGLFVVMFSVTFDTGVAAHLRASVERVLLASTGLTVAACAVVLAAAWNALGSRGLIRRLSDEAFLPIQSMWNTEKTAAFTAEHKLRQSRRPIGGRIAALERLALTRMRRLSDHPMLRSLWGTLYVQTGKTAPARAANLIALCLVLVVATVAVGFYGSRSPDAPTPPVANLLLLVVYAISADYRVNPYATLLLNVSRKNRFRSIVFSALAQALLVAAVAAVLTAISIFSGRYLHEITIYGDVHTYRPIHPRAVFFFAPMLPTAFLSQVVFPRHHIAAMIVIASIVSIFFVTTGEKVLEAPLLGLLLLQVVSWLPFVVFIRHYCYSWDLKLNGR